jgi:hypothetical protein
MDTVKLFFYRFSNAFFYRFSNAFFYRFSNAFLYFHFIVVIMHIANRTGFLMPRLPVFNHLAIVHMANRTGFRMPRLPVFNHFAIPLLLGFAALVVHNVYVNGLLGFDGF